MSKERVLFKKIDAVFQQEEEKRVSRGNYVGSL